MTTPVEALERLDAHAQELDKLSHLLAQLARELEPIEEEYQKYIDDFEIGLYLKSESGGKRLPSEALRVKLARQEISAGVLGRRDGLTRKRERVKQRISDLRIVVEAERSVLSALKLEAEAGGGGLRRAA